MNVLTKEDKSDLETKLFELKKKRKGLVVKLDEARREGDLKENSAYHEIKNQLMILEDQAGEIEKRLRLSTVVDKINGNDQVGLGSRAVLVQGKHEKKVVLVGAGLGDPLSGKVSIDSPLGKALMGRKKGETVLIEIPKGKVEYKIIEVK